MEFIDSLLKVAILRLYGESPIHLDVRHDYLRGISCVRREYSAADIFCTIECNTFLIHYLTEVGQSFWISL